jgi:hypothetical protein
MNIALEHFVGLQKQIVSASIYTPPPRVGTAPNVAVQRGPIALPNLLCARSFTQKLCPHNGPANA